MRKVRHFISVLNGFRKFSIMLGLILIGAIFRIGSVIIEKKWGISLLSGAEMVDLLKTTTIAYMSFNGIEHMTAAIKGWVSKKF